jgi:hypothetical protein
VGDDGHLFSINRRLRHILRKPWRADVPFTNIPIQEDGRPPSCLSRKILQLICDTIEAEGRAGAPNTVDPSGANGNIGAYRDDQRVDLPESESTLIDGSIN